MQVNRVFSGDAVQMAAGSRTERGSGTEAQAHSTDGVQLGARPAPDETEAFARLGRARGTASPGAASISLMGLVEPKPDVRPARNDTPVVGVHGTMADAKSINPYLQPVLDAGHPVDLDTYTTIKQADPLQESGQLISRDINADRIKIARKHIDQLNLIRGDLGAIKQFLSMEPGLYGTPDPAYDRVAALLPGTVDRLRDILSGNSQTLQQTFSSQTKKLEDDLAQQVTGTGFGAHIADEKVRGEVCRKIAAEIMDSIAPREIGRAHV